MPRKPETTFIARVHKHLPPELHREKRCNPYRSGAADVWYSGNGNDLWVEYKFLPKLPIKPDTLIKPTLSALQLDWLTRRRAEGRNIALVIGCPAGGAVIPPPNWAIGVSAQDFKNQLYTPRALADWLVQWCMR